MISQLLTQIATVVGQLPAVAHDLGTTLNGLISWLVG